MKSHVRGNVHGLRQRWMANSMSVVAAIMLMVCGPVFGQHRHILLQYGAERPDGTSQSSGQLYEPLAPFGLR